MSTAPRTCPITIPELSTSSDSEPTRLRSARLRSEYKSLATQMMSSTPKNEAFDHGSSPTGKFGRHFAVALGKRTPTSASTTSTPHVIALVGLPARGKTYISKKLSRYLNWIGVDTKVFNLGDYRRKLSHYNSHVIFDNSNQAGLRLRTKICEESVHDAIKWIENEGGEVAVIDATNTTSSRRKFLYEKIVIEKGYKLFFVESICDDEKIIDANIRTVKISSPDYVNFSEDQVVEDFRKRIKHYESIYETIEEEKEPHLSFMKIFNAGQKVLVHKHEGHIQSRVVYYLMNIKITPRTIYLTRHGESNHNVMMKIGGDAMLTDNGLNYASELGKYINSLNIENLSVWTSWMRRTIQTAKHINGTHERWKTLNELDVGICDGMTYEEIKEHYPNDFRARDEDKYRYRYPRGESYEDLVARLEPVIMELERHGSVIVIGHQAVLRCILAYFTEKDEDELPYIKIPMHTVLTLSPRAYGCEVNAIPINVPCVDTHRPKPYVSGTL